MENNYNRTHDGLVIYIRTISQAAANMSEKMRKRQEEAGEIRGAIN